jgi:hypothetical protein
MPFKSKAQRRMMWATDPKLAEDMQSKTPTGKWLPEYVGKDRKKKAVPEYKGKG